jgi:hypothetical protein
MLPDAMCDDTLREVFIAQVMRKTDFLSEGQSASAREPTVRDFESWEAGR